MYNENNNEEFVPGVYRLSDFTKRATVEDTSLLLLTVLDFQDVNEETFALYYSPGQDHEYAAIPREFRYIINTYNRSWVVDEGEGLIPPQIIIRKQDRNRFTMVIESYPEDMLEITLEETMNAEQVFQFMNFMGNEGIEPYDAGNTFLKEQ